MNTLSFMSANYVARQVGYNMPEGWMQGQNATMAYFEPLDTYAERFGQILADIHSMGFTAMDVWLPHLHPNWATPEHIAIARDLLAKYQLKVVSLAGGFGNTPEEFEASCKLATALGVTILGGGSNLRLTDRPRMVSLLKHYGLRFGYENHPEKTAQAILDVIGDGGDGTIGATVDTGWFGTQNFDAIEALQIIGLKNLFHIHLKDVQAAGAHETCRFGEGVVPIEGCVRVLQKMGYTGAYSIEHEPDHSDPTDDVKASYAMLKSWLNA